MNIRPYSGIYPTIDPSSFIDPSAIVIGKVTIGSNCSVWCNAVIRGDVSHIIIGNNSNIQDLTMLHVSHYDASTGADVPLIIGQNVTVGHNCCLHACTINDNVLVGMGSTILDCSVIESNVFIGAGSLVPPNKVLESGYLYMGSPVKKIRPLSTDEIGHIADSADNYVKLMQLHIG